MRVPELVRDFFKWRWAPGLLLTVGAFAFVGLAVLLIPNQVGPGAPPPDPAVFTPEQELRARTPQALPGATSLPTAALPTAALPTAAPPTAVPPTAVPAPAEPAPAEPAPPSGDLVSPLGNPAAAIEAAAHAREARRRRHTGHADPSELPGPAAPWVDAGSPPPAPVAPTDE